MFCQKCGKEIEDNIKFCPYCGNQVVTTPQPKQVNYNVPVRQKPEKKKKKKWLIGIIAAVVIIVLGIAISSGGETTADDLIDLVQNGYLGNYDTVTVKEVLEYASKDVEWKAGETADGDHYVIEFSSEDIRVQFSIDGLGAETFRLSGIEAEGIDISVMEAYDVKVYMDDLYQLYAEEFPQKGLHIDKSVSNDTLEGHVGPIKSVGESKNIVLEESLVQDLSTYMGYTEDELVAELGYEKNEFGWYPGDTHANFTFVDGEMYLIMLSALQEEDIGKSLCGVKLLDSEQAAADILEKNGFTYDSSFETGNGKVSLYMEDKTGYTLYIDSDESGSITRLSYGKDDEDLLLQDDTGDNMSFDFDDTNWEADYSQWEGTYQREYGPSSTVLLYNIDDEGIMFSIGVGASGYTAYVDIRDYFAEWVDGNTACYVEGFNYVLYITLNNDGSISLEDSQPYAGQLSLSGVYAGEYAAKYPDCEFVFPNSSKDYITYTECEGLNELECKIARNEIYARHGRKFTDESLQGYFDACTWYQGTVEAGDFNENVLNEYEMENLNTIADYEKQMGYR